MSFPSQIRQLLSRLEQAGYRAYCVGGCVRDALLGRQPQDWDISTQATPAQVQALFEKTVPTGLKHGTVTVLLDGGHYEVTTFRTDGAYCDGRHPDTVRFASTLHEDLSRRDFTVNAMAMDLRGTLYDDFGGREDLQRKLLRCVGEPTQRFSEDALRMLRAVRFSAQLDFTIEQRTREAIACCAPLCEKLSRERVRDEVSKTLLSASPERLAWMVAWGLLPRLEVSGSPELSFLTTLPPELTVRLAGLKHCLPALELKQLRLEHGTLATAQRAAALYQPAFTRAELKRLLAAEGRQVADCTAALCGAREQLAEILTSGECTCLRQLAVKGTDFPQLSGEQVGQMLHALLDRVLCTPEYNDRHTLLALAEQIRKGNEMLDKTTEIVREAGKIILSARDIGENAQSKTSYRDPVTVYDRRVEELLHERLGALLPEAAFLGEEEAPPEDSDTAEWLFVVDPIDGTVNFIQGFRNSAISVALLHHGQPELGVVYNPYDGELYTAQRGTGAYLGGTRLHTPDKDLAHSLCLMGTSLYYRELVPLTREIFDEIFDRVQDVRRFGAASLDLCYVAAGRVGSFYECRLSPWDYAAGALIAQEAGACVSAMSGKPLDYTDKCSVAAGSKRAWEQLLAVTAPIMDRERLR